MDDGVIRALAVLGRETRDLAGVLDAFLLAASRDAAAREELRAREEARRAEAGTGGGRTHAPDADADADADAGGAERSQREDEEALPGRRPEPGEEPEQADGAGTEAAAATGAVGVVHSGSATSVHGPRLSVGRASALPDALGIGRALRPLRRPRPSTVRRELDIDATVRMYARSGLLVPQLRPTPEPWLEAVVVLDRGSAMAVWDETIRLLARCLREIGAFREVRIWHLDHPPGRAPELRDQRGRVVEPAFGPEVRQQPASRLLLVVSDCAAASWRTPGVWQGLRVWNRTARVALINPLPPRLWRRSGLDLPRTTAFAATPGAVGGRLGWQRPARLRDSESSRPWQALPVLPLTPEAVLAWAMAVMRMDPAGCDAVLIPASGLPVRRRGAASADASAVREGEGAVGGVTAPTDAEILARTWAFLVDAEPAAVELAVCASSLGEFTLPLLDILRERVVRAGGLAETAEFLTAGLLTAVRGVAASGAGRGESLYRFYPTAAEELRSRLTRERLWQTYLALSKHLATKAQGQGGFAIAWETSESAPAVPTSIIPVLAGAVAATARLLGLDPPAEALPPADAVVGPGAEERARPQIAVTGVPEDQIWVEWIEWHLDHAGIDVGVPSTRTARPLLICSAHLGGPGVHSDPQDQVHTRIVVRVEGAPTGGHVATDENVDLAGLPEAEALAALLAAVDLPAPDPLPEDRPRYPGRPPEIWNVRPRNKAFTGRTALLGQLRGRFRRPSSSAPQRTQALHGVGGSGKSQVALEYVHRFMGDYDLVWWFEAEDLGSLSESFVELSQRLGLRVGGDSDECVEQVRRALRPGSHPQAGRWLLVFDNAVDPEEIGRFLPGGSGHVLVTSRNQAWAAQAELLPLADFGREESIEHLCRRVRGLNRDDAERLAEALGDLPLAVEIAAGCLDTTGVSPDTYLERLGHAARGAPDTPQPNYVATLRATWQLSVERIRLESPAAVRLLQLCAFMDPESIGYGLLYGEEMLNALRPYDEALRERSLIGGVIGAIGRFALARVDDAAGTLQVHPLLQAVIRDQLTPEEREELIHEVHRVLVAARPSWGDLDSPEHWPQFDPIWPHLEPSEAYDCDERDTRQLCIEHLHYLAIRGELDNAAILGRHLRGSWAHKLGEDDRQLLQLSSEFATVLRSAGRVTESLAINQDTLERLGRVLGPDHPLTLQTAGGLAADLRALGRFAEAWAMDEQTHDTLSETLGDDHPLALAVHSALAVDRRLLGDYETARGLDAAVLSARARVIGPRHPITLASRASLGGDLRELGDYQGSITMLREFQEQYPAPLPDPILLRFTKSLAVSLRRAGEEEEAHRLTRATFEQYVAQGHIDLPDALACALNLAADLSVAGDDQAALELARDVQQSCRQTLGATHPFALICGNNVGIYLRRAGQRLEAVELGERVAATLREELGADHPYTLSAQLNLANSLGDTGDLAKAEELGRAALNGLDERYGSEHPATLVCVANLAVTLQAQGVPVAQELQERAISLLSRRLGAHHPHVAAAETWQRIDVDLELPPV